MTDKTHWKKEYNYNYLGSYSLPIGKDLVLTIKETKTEEVIGPDGKKQECFVAYFSDNEKPMILNKTNCKAIQKLYDTPYIEDWVGKKIQVYSAPVKAFGEITDALRIRNVIPKDHKELIKCIKSCKTKEEVTKLFEANKEYWTGEVKQAAVEVVKTFGA